VSEQFVNGTSAKAIQCYKRSDHMEGRI